MERHIELFVTVLCSVMTCSGFWAWFQKRSDKKDLMKDLMVGIAHDRIMQSSMYYIERGYITRDEYENLMTYLYEPYKALGGNGSATHMIEEVNRLEIRNGLIIRENNHEN